jgi:hypothetical protein
MSRVSFPISYSITDDTPVGWPTDPITSVLVIGHGALAKRQQAMYSHWLSQGVTIHCADINESKLEDCPDAIKRYVLPRDEAALKKAISDEVDLLCINNFPNEHIATALMWCMFAKRIVIQKPQDLNLQLIAEIGASKGLDVFRRKTVVQDHYRNKGVSPALRKALPSLLTQRGPLQRLIFVLTEPISVLDELDRAGSLQCGMIQDLAVHMLDCLLGLVDAGTEWQNSVDDDRLHRVIACEGRIAGCHRRRELHSSLGDDVETFAAIDLEIRQTIEFPAGSGRPGHIHPFDALIVVGKGIGVEDNLKAAPLKFVSAEFAMGGGFDAWIDFRTLTVHGFEDHLPQKGQEVNRQHGGLNRPFLLIGPNPPAHATFGLGGTHEELWQSLPASCDVARIAQAARERNSAEHIATYRPGRALSDLLRELVSLDVIRRQWGRLDPFTKYLTEKKLPDEYYD